MIDTEQYTTTSYSRGFPIGFVDASSSGPRHFVYNHVNIIVKYHEVVAGGTRPAKSNGSFSRLSARFDYRT